MLHFTNCNETSQPALSRSVANVVCDHTGSVWTNKNIPASILLKPILESYRSDTARPDTARQESYRADNGPTSSSMLAGMYREQEKREHNYGKLQ